MTIEKEIVQLAKDEEAVIELRRGIAPGSYRLIHGDAVQELKRIKESGERAGLILTSPPYFDLKDYGGGGSYSSYEEYLDLIRGVMRLSYDILLPGARAIFVVGDVTRSRRAHGRHYVIPLHADIIHAATEVGFDYLTPIMWHKITNASLEMGKGGPLGKPYQPGGVIKTEVEYILIFRRPGYRRVDEDVARLSVISEGEYKSWFRQVWDDIPGAKVDGHPAAFPLELAHRLVMMFSYVGDLVIDPFVGSGTTAIAAIRSGRNAIGIDLNPSYIDLAEERLSRFLIKTR